MKKNNIANSIQNKNISFKVTKTINLGIQILRFLLCYWIVLVHCSDVKAEHGKYLYKGFHVPTFMLLSFYFYYSILSNKIIDKVISRFQRLLIPYIFWPLFRVIFRIKGPDGEFTIKNHFLQLLIGCPIHRIFWFQFNLIFLSLFFAIILFAFNQIRINILILLGLFSYYLQISGFIYRILISYTHFFRYNIGSLIELMPLAVNGSIFKSINLIMIVKQCTLFYNFFLFCILFILFKYDIFLNIPGVRYPNVSLNIIASFILFLSFGTLSFERIKKYSYIINLLEYIIQFTGGIYYIHQIVSDFLVKYSIFYFLKGTYSYSLLIYIIIME